MSEFTDHTATVERLQRRLAREKSARLQAETIAERISSERWELRQQLEDKLALRTSELEAARRTASQALTELERRSSTMAHNLRTPLTALLFLSETLSEGNPLSAQQIHDMQRLLTDMQSVLDIAGHAENTPEGSTATQPHARVALADIVSAHEGSWHQTAARAGKLLILDIQSSSGLRSAGTADDVNQQVLALIQERVATSEPVIELHLTVGSDGLEIS